jgi:hypothetical protein
LLGEAHRNPNEHEDRMNEDSSSDDDPSDAEQEAASVTATVMQDENTDANDDGIFAIMRRASNILNDTA